MCVSYCCPAANVTAAPACIDWMSIALYTCVLKKLVPLCSGPPKTSICFTCCPKNVPTNEKKTKQCWCAVDADLEKISPELALSDCDFQCEGTTTGEYCGGRNKMTAYTIDDGAVPPDNDGGMTAPEYIGCFEDRRNRAMNKEGKQKSSTMTNEVSILAQLHCRRRDSDKHVSTVPSRPLSPLHYSKNCSSFSYGVRRMSCGAPCGYSSTGRYVC